MTQISFKEYMAIQAHLQDAKHYSRKAESYAKTASAAAEKAEKAFDAIVARQAKDKGDVQCKHHYYVIADTPGNPPTCVYCKGVLEL